MELKQAIKILKDHNVWRRYNSIDPPKTHNPEMAQPKELGIAIDTVVQHFENKTRNKPIDINKYSKKIGKYIAYLDKAESEQKDREQLEKTPDNMKLKDILKLYINDLKNIVAESPARNSRIYMLEEELEKINYERN